MDRQNVKPPFTYYGGKTTLADKIVRVLPAHSHYVEPFAGSLAVLLSKPPIEYETVNDLDGDLVHFWRVLRDQPDGLARAAMLTPHARAEYELSKNLEGTDDLERARRVWVRLTQSRSQSMKPTGWKYSRNPEGRSFSITSNVRAFAERMELVARRIARVQLESLDAVEVIQNYGRHAGVCIYADPPYVGSTRATNYGVEMTRDDQHEDFAEACREAKSSVVVSGYGSGLYDDLFGDWHRLEMKAPVTLSGDTDRVEVLWSNRPIGEPDLFSEAAS